ncbi:4-carboxy-4-hydroxy-2-oxoadipate aldolase/oxaloacetate decarboxylase [Burkholderia anthina]|uniref:4-carboxy-4-hydroxy-2-oxoadipate aldolase/oxaloacetate decarboxylase n=1 Tax=Burkholderia anthina TaxID=179879 RepID=UPI001CF4AF7B|nr:4-carboxy-4-hydroxy-2-oxoadipate aldolase/oxaloacetate decarboxylase [Burkholderia anthina]MCA8094876.1 4-carboxy-4-hydroxy-2-oxoadipate aldolase/oxaloacetate decarboxylase [Burkholderia anthina]
MNERLRTDHTEEAAREPHARIDAALLERARAFDTATLHEASGKRGALPSAIKPVAPRFRLAGPAVTVHGPGGDNLWLHRAIYAAQPGEVLVVSVSGATEHGYWGEVMSTAARARGLAGLVIDGCVRDGALLEAVGFPVFARGLCIRGTGKDFDAQGFINRATLIGDVIVQAGDLVVGDEDGVVVIARESAATTLDAAQNRVQAERQIMARLEQGESTLDIYGWH